jgi:TolA-binding protein
MTGRCDRLWEVEAVRDGRLSAKAAAAAARHARTCAVCAEAIAMDRSLRDLAEAVRATGPTELELRRLRARVMRDAAQGGRPAPRWRAPAAAVATVIVLALAVGDRASGGGCQGRSGGSRPSLDVEGALSGVVSPEVGARWSQAREGRTEHVRLDDGTLRVRVRHQREGERFVVDLPDGELEVRGTTFDITANASRTEHVHVHEGVVTLRIREQPELSLGAGSDWRAPTTAAPIGPGGAIAAAPIEPPGVPSPPASRSPARAGHVPPAPYDGSEAYARAVRLLTGQQFAAAADALDDFVRAHPTAPEAEDASYLEAVALARGGRIDAAGLAAERHLKQFPASFHRKEAALLVARAAREHGGDRR